MMDEYIQVFTTTDSREKAGNIARQVVEKKLAACVHITGPVSSVYRWQEKINEDEEWLMIFKSRLELYEALEREIKTLHDYDVPEILAIPVVNGNKDYLDWLKNETV
jgi:periplasmic divalent cation tolerance protein